MSQWFAQLVFREEFEACDAIARPISCDDQEEKSYACQTDSLVSDPVRWTIVWVEPSQIDGVRSPHTTQSDGKNECSSC